MKKLRIAFLLFLIYLPLSTAVSALPIYYTFEGKVNYYFDPNGIAAKKGLDVVGAPLNYTIMMDTEVDSPVQLSPSYKKKPLFHTSYLYGSALSVEQSPDGKKSDKYSTWEYNVGSNTLASYLTRNSYLLIYTKYSYRDSWEVGDAASVYNTVYGAGNYALIRGDLSLTRISSENHTAPVPEPGTMIMVCIGLGLLIFRYKKLILA